MQVWFKLLGAYAGELLDSLRHLWILTLVLVSNTLNGYLGDLQAMQWFWILVSFLVKKTYVNTQLDRPKTIVVLCHSTKMVDLSESKGSFQSKEVLLPSQSNYDRFPLLEPFSVLLFSISTIKASYVLSVFNVVSFFPADRREVARLHRRRPTPTSAGPAYQQLRRPNQTWSESRWVHEMNVILISEDIKGLVLEEAISGQLKELICLFALCLYENQAASIYSLSIHPFVSWSPGL